MRFLRFLIGSFNYNFRSFSVTVVRFASVILKQQQNGLSMHIIRLTVFMHGSQSKYALFFLGRTTSLSDSQLILS